MPPEVDRTSGMTRHVQRHTHADRRSVIIYQILIITFFNYNSHVVVKTLATLTGLTLTFEAVQVCE